MKIKVRGKTFKLKWGKLSKGDYGLMWGKNIRIRKGMKARIELDTLIHEMLHAAYPDLDEEAVNTTATDIARVLWRLGWRKT